MGKLAYIVINIKHVLVHSPPLKVASAQSLPFLAEHSPQQPALYATTLSKINK